MLPGLLKIAPPNELAVLSWIDESATTSTPLVKIAPPSIPSFPYPLECPLLSLVSCLCLCLYLSLWACRIVRLRLRAVLCYAAGGAALYTARAQMKPLMIAGVQHGGQVGCPVARAYRGHKILPTAFEAAFPFYSASGLFTPGASNMLWYTMLFFPQIHFAFFFAPSRTRGGPYGKTKT